MKTHKHFLNMSCWIFLRMSNVSDRSCRENQNTFYFQYLFFFANRNVLWDNVVNYGRTRQATDDNITRRMGIECRLTKTTNTQSECVILTAFRLQQWLHERPSIIRYITFPVSFVAKCFTNCNLKKFCALNLTVSFDYIKQVNVV